MPRPPEARRRTSSDNRSSLLAATRPAARCVTRSMSHGAPVSIVQCKHWSDRKPVGVDKICELRGVMAAHNIRSGQFACTARYTDAARDNQIHLLDGALLLDLIAKRTPLQQQAPLDVALEGEYWRPTCVNCGVKMVFRVPRQKLEATLRNYLATYKHRIPLQALDHLSPVQALKYCKTTQPE